MEATASKPRRGRPAKAGAPMASFTLHLPADVITLLDDEAQMRGYANRASLLRVVLFSYFHESSPADRSPEYAIRRGRAMRALMRTAVAAGDLGTDADKALEEMDGIVNLFEDPDAEEKEAGTPSGT